MKYLITNADDFGWKIDITKGILESNKNGVLTSASVLINEADAENIDLIKSNDSIGLGIHLNIATGEPVTSFWKTKYGSFDHPKRIAPGVPYNQGEWNNYYGEFAESAIFDEFESQISLFKEKLGKLPDHMDTHYHTFSAPNVFEVFVSLSKKYNLPVRQPIGFTSETGSMEKTEKSEMQVVNTLLDKLSEFGVKTTTYFSLEYVNLHPNYIEVILSEIDKIKDGETIEISFHPGYLEPWRNKQVEILTDPELKKSLEKANVKLINFNELSSIK